MKFIDFLKEGFSDREDYNDFLSFYKKMIKSIWGVGYQLVYK